MEKTRREHGFRFLDAELTEGPTARGQNPGIPLDGHSRSDNLAEPFDRLAHESENALNSQRPLGSMKKLPQPSCG